MTEYKVYLLNVAEIELDEAYEWYNQQKAGLGYQLVGEVSRYLKMISENPFIFAVRYQNDFRFAALKVFPYLIAYWIEEKSQSVYVASIFHTSRNPLQFETLLPLR
ncbi:type II toxin-antitoxin system RelE/ParE family toxin [Dyadobacter sandarakinus]|uniref:Type II toxin-antitoxin system RelE/ParE family toxin n=1 Tax=Dyadobacter sandarakinus TaxID=2747268 RepID=A0ABX7IBE5_9BACT|nr:type II toxin-antitoxin system RelE/ParE family toxin [Dyadobacter sandarakinus]QRR03446.1 type II toxin-antitoxin system RelE/ParE family toxin [Dyadobacter sandarakinus]